MSFENYRLSGDEDCGVSLHCRRDGCWDGGRPLAYYDGGNGPIYVDDPAVENVISITALLVVADKHEHDVHGGRRSRYESWILDNL